MPKLRWRDLQENFLIGIFLIVLLLSSPPLLSQGSISFTPSGPNVEEPVTFTLTPPGRFAGTVQWDFGDKSTASGGTTISHKYLSAGNFVVKATVTVGGRPNTTQIKVAITEKRRVISKPTAPKAGEPVIFQAKNFLTSSIKWDFGDGSSKTSGPDQSHAFSRPGTFKVTATDLRGTSCCPVAISVTVAAPAAAGPAPAFTPSVPFTVSSVELRFEDGKTYAQASRNFAPLFSYADIKYEGSGLFEAQWLVDGRPFKSVSLTLPAGRAKTIDSGAALPTQTPGAHEVSLQITQPKVPFKPPTIRYLVVEESAQERIALTAAEVRDFETNGIIIIDDNRITLTPGRKYLLKGTIKNTSDRIIPNTLVFITLSGKNMDQKRFANLKPGETRAFETSFLNEAGAQKVLRFDAFETAAKERLLARREVSILMGGVQVSRPPSKPIPAPGVPSTPTISSLNPDSVEAGSGAIDPLTINGSGFAEGAMARLRPAGETGTGENYTPASIDTENGQILVTIPETWTSEAKSLEIRVRNPDGSGGWLNSDWFPFQVTIGTITAKVSHKIPPKVPEIKEISPVIAKLSPDHYWAGQGPIDPFIIEGQNFIMKHLTTTDVLVRFNEYLIFSAHMDDPPEGLSESRIVCRVPEWITLISTNLKVSVQVKVAEQSGVLNAEAVLPCRGKVPRIATLVPYQIVQHTQNAKLNVYAPNNSKWGDCFKGDLDVATNVMENCVVAVKPAGGGPPGGKGEIIPARCWDCATPGYIDHLEIELPPQWTAEARDLEVKAGNPDGQGGYVWGNSLILPIVPPRSRALADYEFPDTEILELIPADLSLQPPQVRWVGIKGEADIMGYEWAVPRNGNSPGDSEWNWLDQQWGQPGGTGTSSYKINLAEHNIPDAERVFWIRTVDVNGRRDPQPAVTQPFLIDRFVTVEVTLLKIRVDDDADPPGQKGEVFFDYAVRLNLPLTIFAIDLPSFGDPDRTPCAQFNDTYYVWEMDSGDSRDLDIVTTVAMEFPVPRGQLFVGQSNDTNIVQMSVRGKECDRDIYPIIDGGEPVSMGGAGGWFEIYPSPQGYKYRCESLGLSGDIKINQHIEFSDASSTGEDIKGAFTIWGRIFRID